MMLKQPRDSATDEEAHDGEVEKRPEVAQMTKST